MRKKLRLLTILMVIYSSVLSQDYGNLPTIEKEDLLLDLELLHQGLDKFHTGMYWYTPKDSVDIAFQNVKNKINRDMNVLEFHKLVAPLVALSREDHTDISLPQYAEKRMKSEVQFFPFVVKFLDEKMYIIKNGSNNTEQVWEGQEIEQINGESPKELVKKLGSLFASDGYIQAVKYQDLSWFSFSRYYYFYYGEIPIVQLKLKNADKTIEVSALFIQQINENLNERYPVNSEHKNTFDPLEFKILQPNIAYLGIHDFANDDIRKQSKYKTLKYFLQKSFQTIAEKEIETVIVDVSKNGGGTEGNEGLLFSYFGENYQKYNHVKAKTQKAILDNGVDKPITLKTYGRIERLFTTKKMSDGSIERRQTFGNGLMAYKNEPKNKFSGKVYIIISPTTYSGGSEFANMMRSQNIATFVGEETGGGYHGNTSGYSRTVTLPHSRIELDIPALQFDMNVEAKKEFGRGVLPDIKIVPSIEEYQNGINAPLQYILKQENK